MLCGRIHSVHSPTTLSLYHIFPEKSSPCREIPFFFVNSLAHAVRSGTEKESPSPGGGGPAAGDPQIPDRLCMPADRQPSYHRAKRMPAYRRNRQTGPFPPLWFSGDRRSRCMSIRAISDIRPLPLYYTTKLFCRQDSSEERFFSIFVKS